MVRFRESSEPNGLDGRPRLRVEGWAEPSSTAPNMMREREWTRLYMHTRSLITRASGKVRRLLADQFGRRTLSIKTPVPIVSFTFDDAPVTAFREGRGILKQFGARASCCWRSSLSRASRFQRSSGSEKRKVWR